MTPRARPTSPPSIPRCVCSSSLPLSDTAVFPPPAAAIEISRCVESRGSPLTRRRGACGRRTLTPSDGSCDMTVTNEDLPSRRIFRRNGGALRHSDPLELPFELDARRLLHAPAHRLAQSLDIRGGGAAEIDQEVAVHLRNLGVAVFQAAAAGGIDELPRFLAGRILERRAAGAALNRLRCLARFGDFLHFGRDRGRITGRALEQRLREDDVVRRAAMAIVIVHVAVGA